MNNTCGTTVEPVNLEDGFYNGVISGWTVTINSNQFDKTNAIKMDAGYRGMNLKCIVFVKDNVGYCTFESYLNK